MLAENQTVYWSCSKNGRALNFFAGTITSLGKQCTIKLFSQVGIYQQKPHLFKRHRRGSYRPFEVKIKREILEAGLYKTEAEWIAALEKFFNVKWDELSKRVLLPRKNSRPRKPRKKLPTFEEQLPKLQPHWSLEKIDSVLRFTPVIEYHRNALNNRQISPYVVALAVKARTKSPLLRRKIQAIQGGLLGGQDFTPIPVPSTATTYLFRATKNYKKMQRILQGA